MQVIKCATVTKQHKNFNSIHLLILDCFILFIVSKKKITFYANFKQVQKSKKIDSVEPDQAKIS